VKDSVDNKSEQQHHIFDLGKQIEDDCLYPLVSDYTLCSPGAHPLLLYSCTTLPSRSPPLAPPPPSLPSTTNRLPPSPPPPPPR
jgi:hypothetical protein